jgi:lipid II:glycine glycyltransferase (peptidoglycan interpeptide bridge formation enzyme)
MLVYKYKKFADMPGYENYTDKIPVFATQNYADYLKEIKGHDTVWFAYIENNTACYLLPFTVIKKLIFRKGYFLTGVVSFDQENSLEKEKEFLENVIIYIKKDKLCDWIQQGPNWALFNTFPSASKAVRFGTYRIYLKGKSEDELYSAIYNADRRSIRKAENNNVMVKKGVDYLNDCLEIINSTARTANLDSLSADYAKKLLNFLNDNIKIYVSYKEDIPQCSAVFIGNKFCTYAHYAGSIIKAFRGSNVLLNWEAIKDAKNNGCEYFDFVGARINPPPGSKLERIQRFKEHFGSELIQGYLWKMNFSVFKYYIYQFIVRITYFVKMKKYKRDIIDEEIKIKNFN